MIGPQKIILNDGQSIPQLGFGVWRVQDAEATQVVGEALNVGYRLIDTAAIYMNEAGVGEAIRRSEVPRKEIYLTTKVWNDDQGYDQTLRAFEKSFKLLKQEYVDLYLVHWPVPSKNKYVESWKALQKIKADGLVKSVGVSNFYPEHLQRLLNETGQVPVLNQVELHPSFQQKELRQFHQKHQIMTEAWSPLARTMIFENKVIQQLAQKYQKTPAQIILRWHMDSNIIAIPKSSHPQRMRENFNIFDFQLTLDDLQKISVIDDINGRTSADPQTMGS